MFRELVMSGTQETNINAGTQDHDSDSEVDEQVIVVPSFPSNRFAGPSSSNGPSIMERNADYAEELAKLQRQEYEAKDAAARYGYLFSQATAEILCQAEAEIRDQGVSAVKDPAGVDSAVKDPAGDVSDGSPSAGSDPAGGNPADSSQPAGSFEPAEESNPAVSSSVSADFIHVYADESTLPPGQQLGSSENTTRFSVPSDVCMDQISSGIFTSSSSINQQVWKLVPLPAGKHAIGTKWILKNKRDARGIVVRNKARLVAQGHRQEEGIDYDELDRWLKASVWTQQAPRPVCKIVLLFLLQTQLQRGTIDKTPSIKKDSGYNLVQGNPLQVDAISGKVTLMAVQIINYVATSSTEAEYVAAASCCAQVLWIQNQLLDYGFNFMNTKIFIDNQSTICIVKNPVFHQRTKHIEIRHHFIRDANEKNLIQVLKIHTDDNVADLLTKAFDGPRFAYLSILLLVVILPAASLVSAGSSMFLLVVILPAASLVSAGSSMFLLVVILPAASLVSAGSSMFLLVVILPAEPMDYAADSVNMLVGILLLVDPFLLIGCMFLLTAGFLLLDDSFLLAEYIPAAGVVYAVITSIHAAGLISAGGIMFLLADLFLLVVTSFYCAQLNIAGWLVYATSHLVSAGTIVRPNATGSHDLVATIDGREVVVTESLIRAQLQLDDANGIFDMQIDDIFAGMGAIGYPPVETLLKWAGEEIPLSPPMLAIAAAGDAADEPNAAANEAAGSTAEAHPAPHSPPFSPVRESTPERQPETEWVVPNPVSPGTDWRPWPSVPAPRPPTPPAQTLSFEEPLVFGPVPKPAGYVDPDTIDPIIFGPPPRPYDFVDPALEEPVIFGPLPRPANYKRLEELTVIISIPWKMIPFLVDSMKRHLLGLMMLLPPQPMLLGGQRTRTSNKVYLQRFDSDGTERLIGN
ncbi:putative ribonuclease H-like domain-containing protein [Tanacetum coccineum]